MSVVIGIDPGEGGAMVALDEDGVLLGSITADGRGRSLGYFIDGDPDPIVVSAWLGSWRDLGVLRVVLETVYAPGRNGTTAALTIGRRWGSLYATVRLLRLPLVTVTPAKWSADLFGGKKGGDAAALKAAAVRLTSERVPMLQLVPEGCRKPHDGLADAACLALWGLR